MKTLTEFDGFRIKHALNLRKELSTSGKTPEELPAALGEALKLEGDKLTTLLHALEVAESRLDNLKRVVVFAAEEGKPAPKGAVDKEGKHFLAEYFFSAQPKGRERGHGRDKGGRGDGKRGKGRGGRESGRGGRDGAGGRSAGPGRGDDSRPAGGPAPIKIVLQPRPAGATLAPGHIPVGEATGEARERKPRRRRPRGPRREGAPGTQAAGQDPSAPPKPHKLPVPNKVPEAVQVQAPAPQATEAASETQES